MNVNELKVGDRVGYGKHHWDAVLYHGFGTVSKINKYGHITVTRENGSVLVFDKHGNERGTSYSQRRLMDAEVLENILARRELDNRVQDAVNLITTELSQHKNGMGQYLISEQAKAKLVALVNTLPVNYVED